MPTITIAEQVRWQDLKVRGEIDIVFEIAKREGWDDCEVFGYGDMLTEPRESMGWDLIPADLYEHSIPPEAVARLHQIIDAGIRVQGVIVADDQRKTQPALVPSPAPAKPRFSLPSLKPVVSGIGKAVNRVLRVAGTIASFFGNVLVGLAGAVVSLIGKAVLGLIYAAGAIALIGLAGYLLIHYFWLALPLGFLILINAASDSDPNRRVRYDPKLVVLVDDGNGSTVWVSLFTWYD